MLFPLRLKNGGGVRSPGPPPTNARNYIIKQDSVVCLYFIRTRTVVCIDLKLRYCN